MTRVRQWLGGLLRPLMLAAGLAAGLGHVPAAEAGEIWTVTSEDNFPPYNFWMKGRRSGLDVAIAEAILHDMDVTVLHQGLGWEEVLKSLDRNRTDLAFQLVGTPDRFAKYQMVGPFRTGTTVLVARSDFKGKFETMEDLKGLKIGVVSGFTYTPEFTEATLFEKVPASTNLTSFRRLMLGSVDLIAGDLQAILYIAENDGMKDRIQVLPKPLGYIPRYFAVPVERKDKAQRFRAAFEKLNADGTIQKIVDGWESPLAGGP